MAVAAVMESSSRRTCGTEISGVLPSSDGVAAALHRERGVEQDAFASHDGGQGCHCGWCFGEGNEGLGMVGRVGSGGGSFNE